MLYNYFKTAIRNIRRNKTNSFLNIAGLSVGITCAALIFLWMEDELTYDDYHVKKDALYQVYQNLPFEGKIYTSASTSGPLAQGMKNEMPGVKNVCRTTWRQKVLFSKGENVMYEEGYYADSSIFDLFTLPFVEGSPAHAFDQLHSVVICESMAKKIFGSDKNVVGKTLKVDNKDEYVIKGVMKDLPQNSNFHFKWVAPFEVFYQQNKWLDGWNNFGIQTFVELSNKTDVNALNAKLKNYIPSKDTSSVAQTFLLAMKDWRLRSTFENGKPVTGRIQYVRMFTTIAWIILLIACINFMNLATALSEKRAKEVGVKKVLGAAKKLLVFQFFGEALLMSFVAVGLAVLIIYIVLPSFNTLVDKDLHLSLNKPSHILWLIGIASVCGIVSGSYPSLYLSSFKPVLVFKGLSRRGTDAVFIRKSLVVLQFSISVALIVSTIVIYKQIQHVKSRDLGYNKNNLIMTNLTGNLKKNFDVVKHDLLATGAVDNAAMSMLNLLWMGSSNADYSWEGKNPSSKVLITHDWVTPEYIKTAGMKIKQGRDFYPAAKQDSSSVIINEQLARMLDKENAVGKTISLGTKKFTVIGVTSDFVYGDMYKKSDPLIFFSYPDYYNFLYIRLNPNENLKQSLAKVESVIKQDNPGYPFEYTFVDDDFNKIFEDEMLIDKLSRLFAGLTIFISCLGLFGLAAYTAERRTKEIGIRKVLGASATSITSLLSSDFLKLILISFVIGFPVAWWMMNQWLQDYAYRIEIGWGIFAITAFTALLIALLTISFQSIKAATANPVNSLRSE